MNAIHLLSNSWRGTALTDTIKAKAMKAFIIENQFQSIYILELEVWVIVYDRVSLCNGIVLVLITLNLKLIDYSYSI